MTGCSMTERVMTIEPRQFPFFPVVNVDVNAPGPNFQSAIDLLLGRTPAATVTLVFTQTTSVFVSADPSTITVSGSAGATTTITSTVLSSDLSSITTTGADGLATTLAVSVSTSTIISTTTVTSTISSSAQVITTTGTDGLETTLAVSTTTVTSSCPTFVTSTTTSTSVASITCTVSTTPCPASKRRLRLALFNYFDEHQPTPSQVKT